MSPELGNHQRNGLSRILNRGRGFSLESTMGHLFDFQRSPGRNAFPLVNRLWGNSQRFGELGFVAEVLGHLFYIIGVHGQIVSLLTFYVNTLTVTWRYLLCKMTFMNIGQRIKQARLARKPKITQQQLADAVGVSRPAVTQWETGETKALEGENLDRVARALGVTTEWLLYGASSPPTPAKVAVANDDQGGLSRRALLLAQVFDQLCPDQQDALQTLLNAFAQPKTDEFKVKAR